MGLTWVKIKVSNPANKKSSKDIEFLVDSGALYSFVNKGDLKEIGVAPETTKEFILANGDIVKRRVGIARFHYKGSMGGAPVVFAENGDENLLGATTLESLGLTLNPFRRELTPLTLTA